MNGAEDVAGPHGALWATETRVGFILGVMAASCRGRKQNGTQGVLWGTLRGVQVRHHEASNRQGEHGHQTEHERRQR